MKFQSIGFHNFRNLADSLIVTDTKEVILVGINGQGKTNFLEALYLLCYGSSFRSVNSREICKHGQREFSVSGVFADDDGIQQRLLFRFSEGKREIRIDGKEIRDRRELLYHVPCIVFCHDDIEFVRGTPESRRKFFDQTMSLYNPLFFDDLRRYRLVLKQRNAAIKEQYYTLVPVYDEQLAQLGMVIQEQRKQAVSEFNTLFGPLYREVSQTDAQMHIVYKPSWGDCETVEDVRDKLERTFDRDIRMQTTASGIHRDQFIVMDASVPFASSGSTGQMRLASLLFRIAQVQSYREKTGKYPIVLIDDVLLELDMYKRELFLDKLGGYSQAFFTFLPDEHYFSEMGASEALTYRVEDGTFMPI